MPESSSQLWRVYGCLWTVEDEHHFGRWIEAQVTEDFFMRHKIPVDCADVPYALRWIYARIAHLPAAATTKNNAFIGHWSTQWGHLPAHPLWERDKRFRTALIHMLSETSTRTMPLDTYPVRVSPEAITPGTVFFITESHAGVIASVSLDGSYAHPLQTWEATVPSKPQKLSLKSFLSPRPESTIYSGLVKFRWPVVENGRWRHLSPSQHPFYSLEQYGAAFYTGYADYVDAVGRRIDPKEYDPWDRVSKLIDTITRFLRVRVPIVLEGHQRCRKGGCPEGSDLWEIHSTPGRDGMITLLMDHLSMIIESNRLDPDVVRTHMEGISIEISKGRSVTFDHVFRNYLWLSPHPEDPVEWRWGLGKCDMILRQVRNVKSSIAFIEKSYRKRDPRYADFAIGQQQAILKRLNAEWTKSQCRDPQYPLPEKKMGPGVKEKAGGLE